MNPGAELRLISKLAQMQVRGEEALLGNLRCLCLRAGDPHCETVEIVPISFNQPLKGKHVVFHRIHWVHRDNQAPTSPSAWTRWAASPSQTKPREEWPVELAKIPANVQKLNGLTPLVLSICLL